MSKQNLPASAWMQQKHPAPVTKRAKKAVDYTKTEEFIHYRLCAHLATLRLRMDDMHYRPDWSGIKLPLSMLRKIWPSKFKNSPYWASDLQSTNGWPDLQIIKAGSGQLYIELKKDGVRLRNRKGLWADDHVAEQAYMLRQLRLSGSYGVFAIGYDEAVWAVETWLKTPERLHELSKHPIMR